MAGDKLIPAWYALHTKSRFENVVNEGLSKKALDVFLPKITVKSPPQNDPGAPFPGVRVRPDRSEPV